MRTKVARVAKVSAASVVAVSLATFLWLLLIYVLFFYGWNLGSG